MSTTTATTDPPVVPDNHPTADTYDWDTALVVNFDTANRAMANHWGAIDPAATHIVQAANDDPSFAINGVFGPWALTEGGDGKNVRIECPFATGTYSASGKTYDLGAASTSVVIEVGMEWVPDPGQQAFVLTGDTVASIMTALDGSTISTDLSAAFAAHGVTLDPAATVRPKTAGVDWYLVSGATTYWLFHTVDKDNDSFLSIYATDKTFSANLKLLQAAAEASVPAVTIVTIVHNPTSGIAAAVLPELLSTWFNVNIGAFDHVFATLDITPQVDEADHFHWLKPTETSYAVVDNGATSTSLFGVLTTVGDSPPALNHQISPNAIPSGPDAPKVDAGYLIAGTDFIRYMMLPGAQQIFDGASIDSFEIVNDGLTVQNTKQLVWGKFMMDGKQRGSVPNAGYDTTLDTGTMPDGLADALDEMGVPVYGYGVSVTAKGSQWLLSAAGQHDEYILDLANGTISVWLATTVTIAAGQFKMTLVHSYVQIEFIDLYYPQDSSFDVHINYTEQVKLGLTPQNGRQIFWYTQVLKNLEINVTKTHAAITREIVEGAITAALSLIAIAGPIIEGLSSAAEIGEVTDEAGQAVVDARAFAEAEEANPGAAEEDDDAAGDNAAAQSNGKLANIKAAFGAPRWKFVGALAALSGAVAGGDNAISAIIEAAVKEEWQNVPAFDQFANLAIAPYTFPNVSGMTLATAWLADSLQLGFTVQSTSPAGS